MPRIFALSLLVVGLLSPGVARAGEAPAAQQEGPRRSGFYLRLQAALAFGDHEVDGVGSLDGLGPLIVASTGGWVSKHIALHADVSYQLLEPLEVTGATRAHQLAMAAGVTFYFEGDFSVSALVGVSRLSLEHRSRPASERWGPIVAGVFGKEWWVADRWAIGIGADVRYTWIDDARGYSAGIALRVIYD